MDYLIRKIKNAKYSDEPFNHIYIENFFSESDFQKIISFSEVNFPKLIDDSHLFKQLASTSYEPISFPGCTTNIKSYTKWHGNKNQDNYNQDTCEGFGMAFRNKNIDNHELRKIVSFFNSNQFRDALMNKFHLKKSEVNYDYGLQKYLDGYEISPHPDRRDKALTYMININPCSMSDQNNIHTRYLKLKKKYNWISEYWKYNELVQTCWLPWQWFDTEFIQTKNNSIVIFAPSYNTFHAVQAKYDHLAFQRTQIYGNFWFKKRETKLHPQWRDYVIKDSPAKYNLSKFKLFWYRLFKEKKHIAKGRGH